MVLTISIVKQTFIGDMKRIVADIAFDASYPTDGEPLTPDDLGLYSIDFLNASPKLGYMFEYDYTNEKLKAFMPFKTHTPTGTNNGPAFTGSELATHQHAAKTAGTPAGTNDTPAFTGSELGTHQHDAITAGTPSGTNGASVVTPGNHETVEGITVGTPKLLHDADPVNNKAAAALYIVEAYGVGNKNIGVLQSNCAGTTSIIGSTDDVSGICGAATPRFFVTHNASPSGVAIYVDEADNDKLVFISPTETDAIIIMPFEAIANGVPGYAYAVTVHHKASMSGCSALFFDDNGAADSQLVFVEDATTNRVIYASDIEVIAAQYTGITGNCGSAAAQVFSGAEMSTHQHAAITAGTPAGSVAAPVFTGSELATHQHDAITAGTPAGTNAAPVLTGTEITQSEGEEVDNTDDLSGITGVRIIADGR